jgi:hypothetical protein
MKILKNTLMLLVLLFLTFSCSKDDDAPSINRTLQQGAWRISLFVDSGTDETPHFTGYQLTFANNGVITATRPASVSVTGSYSTGTDDNQSKLILNFGSAMQFNELNEDWRIVERTSTRIRLEHVSGGNGGTDLLTFERI